MKPRTELYTINAHRSEVEVCHLSRPIENMIQEVGNDSIVYLAKVAPFHPKLAEYTLDHHFHEDGEEHIVVNTQLFIEDMYVLAALTKDCKFKIQTFISQVEGEDIKPVSVRERAAEIMGKVKGLDSEDALEILDPRWAEYLKAKESGRVS